MLSDMELMPIVQLGNYTLTIELEDLNDEVREIAKKELRENPDVSQQAIKELRDLLKGINAL